MAQYAVLIYAHGSNATQEAHERHADELVHGGALITAYALTAADMATSVSGDSVTDGPFVDAKEVVAGFYVIEAADLDAALAIAARNPAAQTGGGVEVRPVAGSLIPQEAA
jgi:hypothetical protein